VQDESKNLSETGRIHGFLASLLQQARICVDINAPIRQNDGGKFSHAQTVLRTTLEFVNAYGQPFHKRHGFNLLLGVFDAHNFDHKFLALDTKRSLA
jgi:hypothetical protein